MASRPAICDSAAIVPCPMKSGLPVGDAQPRAGSSVTGRSSMREDLQRHVQQLIDALVESGEEIGLQVAAYIDGELVVDAWAGVADEASGRPVDGDTLFTSWSTTKGFVATCVHILSD